MAIGGGVELELDCDGPWCEMQLALAARLTNNVPLPYRTAEESHMCLSLGYLPLRWHRKKCSHGLDSEADGRCHHSDTDSYTDGGGNRMTTLRKRKRKSKILFVSTLAEQLV